MQNGGSQALPSWRHPLLLPARPIICRAPVVVESFVSGGIFWDILPAAPTEKDIQTGRGEEAARQYAPLLAYVLTRDVLELLGTRDLLQLNNWTEPSGSGFGD